jgi:hypothetical protein
MQRVLKWIGIVLGGRSLWLWSCWRFPGIDILVNRTLVHGVLTAVIVGIIYALVVGGMSTLFQIQGNWVIVLLTTGLVAVIFQPLRERWQKWVNRLLYGRRDEPFEVLSSLGQRLENTLRRRLSNCRDGSQTLKLPCVAIAVNHQGKL